jgi:hypothetical protein
MTDRIGSVVVGGYVARYPGPGAVVYRVGGFTQRHVTLVPVEEPEVRVSVPIGKVRTLVPVPADDPRVVFAAIDAELAQQERKRWL